MRCPHCNSKLSNSNKFCPECGVAIVWDDSDKHNNNHIVIAILSILLIAALIVIICLYRPQNHVAVQETLALESTPQQIVCFSDDPIAISEAAQAVVKLNCYNDDDELVVTGSGFSAFDQGIIVTNYHVIEDKHSRIEIVTESGKKCDIVGVVGISAERDIAILYYQHRKTDFDLPILPINTSRILNKGEKVVAIGSPLGLTNVVSTGVFGGYNNNNGFTDIQFTASISSGSSGGALFDNDGNVIGITYASFVEGQNLNLAVPLEFVESLWKAERNDRMSLYEFYDSLIPHYTVDYVLNNYNSLVGVEFYLDCWASSHDQVKDYHVAFCAASYEEIYDPNENDPEIRFQKDKERYSKDNLLKVVTYSHTFSFFDWQYGERHKQKSIHCSGVEWSSEDQKPYVIAN